jgi:SAM-dependent methyltransferase
MKWRQKALLQGLVARLPLHLSHSVHYYLQRRSGGLGSVDLSHRLRTGLDLAECIVKQGRSVESGVFLEIGTGLQVTLPVVLWLCGAAEITTVDLNHYLKAELVGRDAFRMRTHFDEMLRLLGNTPGTRLSVERLNALLAVGDDIDRVLKAAHIRYLAPADATRLDLRPHTIDYHVSYAVLQHIPPEILRDIIAEARRLLKPGGLFVHWIDLSDHFSHGDHSISAVNFLRFSEKEWGRLSGNRFMYQNRLRIDDYIQMLNGMGAAVLSVDQHVNPHALELLQKGFPLDARFAAKDPRSNATTNAWVVCEFR